MPRILKIIALLLITVLILLISSFTWLYLSNSQKARNDSSVFVPSIAPTSVIEPSQTIITLTPSREDTTINTGIKFWESDDQPARLLQFTLPADALVEDGYLQNQPAKIISLNGAKLSLTISHAAIPVTYQEFSKLNPLYYDSMYRVVLQDKLIVYSDELQNTGNCIDSIDLVVGSPCGTPVFDGLHIECSSIAAVNFCDKVMTSLKVD